MRGLPVIVYGLQSSAPIAGPAAVMGQRQNQHALFLNRVQQCKSEFPQHASSNVGSNFCGCFREFDDQSFDSRHLSEEPPPEAGGLEFEIANFIEKFVLGRFMPLDALHLNNFWTLRLTSCAGTALDRPAR